MGGGRTWRFNCSYISRNNLARFFLFPIPSVHTCFVSCVSYISSDEYV